MPDISKAEFDILSAIWEGYPVTANTVIERLNLIKPWHDRTVKTLLSRLVKKKAIDYQKSNRSYLYSPLFARDYYLKKEGKSLVSRLFNGRVAPLVAGFAETDGLSRGDVDELKSIIASWEKSND